MRKISLLLLSLFIMGNVFTQNSEEKLSVLREKKLKPVENQLKENGSPEVI